MIGELEALVGYLFVVGGRAVSAPPPGALVEQPPKKAQRGREQDTFFALVTPAGPTQAQAGFYEQIARQTADLYFKSGGGVTSGLREAITGVNNVLLSHAGAERYQANIICLVLRGAEVYLARAGSVLSLLRQGDTFSSAPTDPRDEYALNGLPVGYSPSPDIKLGHYEIAPGQVIVLSDSGLAAADPDKLSAALNSPSLAAMQDALKALAATKTQAMIIQFAIAGTSAALPSAPKSPVQAIPPAPKIAEPPPKMAAAPDQTVSLPSPIVPIDPTAAKPNRSIFGLLVGVVRAVLRGILGGIAWFLRSIARILNGILDRLLPEPEDGSPHIPATVAAGLAILIPVFVVFIVVALRLTQVDETNYDKLVSQVQDQANQAAAVPRTDPERAKTLWLAVLQRVDMAEQLRPGRIDPTLQHIREQAQSVLDEYAKVTRRPTTALRSFGANARLGAVLVQASTDLYTLDLSQSAIYRDTLRQPDQIGTRGAQSVPIVQLGSAVGSYSAKQIVDIIWMDEGGIRNSHALVGLDTQGILVTYSPTFSPATSQPLQGAERWKSPVALRDWQTKLYILDPGANQIWRYLPSGTTYPNPPEEYFAPEYQHNLNNAIDFSIDERGNVYVLFKDGTVKKYNAGAEQPFSLNGLPEGALKSASAIYLDNRSALPALFICDPIDQSIYEFTLAGAFQSRFRSTDPNAFKNLTGVFVDGSNVYATSGQVVYYFSTADTTVK